MTVPGKRSCERAHLTVRFPSSSFA